MRKWLELSVFTSPEQLDNVAAIFHELGSGGVVIEDPALILDCLERGDPETVAPTLSAPPGWGTVVKGYFPWDGALPGRLETASRLFNELSLGWQTGEVYEEDWATAWQAYFKPVRVGARLVVKPTWEDYSSGPGEIVMEMDPGMAFGCGTHATTAMCLALLEEHLRGGETVYDVGTGSGILSVAAALLGAGRVLAVDIDELAVRTARENTARNGVAHKVTVLQGNLLDNLAGAKADLVVANIIAGVIIRLAPEAAAVLKPGGLLIASGIIRQRAGEVRRALRNEGLDIMAEKKEGEWTAFVVRC